MKRRGGAQRGGGFGPRFPTVKFRNKILIACLLCAVIPVGMMGAVIVWLRPSLLASSANFYILVVAASWATGLTLVNVFIASFLLNRDLHKTFQGLRRALDQFAAGETPARLADLPQDELGQLQAETIDRLGELAALRETTLDLTDERDPSRLLHTLVERASQLMQVTVSVIYEADFSQRQLRLIASYGLDPDLLGRTLPFGEGASGQVVATDQALIVNDYPHWPERMARQYFLANLLCVPMRWRGQLLGVLTLEDIQGTRPFTASDVTLAAQFASHAAAALNNARLYANLTRQLMQLSLLREVANVAVNAPDLDDLILRVLGVLRERLNYEVMSFHLVDAHTGQLHLHPTYHRMYPEMQVRSVIDLGEGVTGRVAQTGRPVRVGDVRLEPKYVAAASQTLSELCVPLQVGERIIGVLNAEAYRVNAFSDDDEQVLTVIAGLLAPILENTRLAERDRRRLAELALLNEIVITTSASLDQQTVLTAIVASMCHALDVTSAYVVEVQEGRVMTVAEYYGPAAKPQERVSDLGLSYPIQQFPESLRIMESGRPGQVSLETISATERADLDQYAGQAKLIVPMLHHGHPLGYITLWESRQARVFTAEEQQLAQTLAGHAAVAFENAKLYQAAQHRAEQMRLVNEVGQDISQLLERDTLLMRVSQRLEDTFGYQHAKVGLLDGEEIVFQSWHDRQRDRLIPTMRLRLDGPGIIAWVARQAQARLVLDVTAAPDYIANAYFTDTCAEAAIPLIVHNQVIGVLDVQSEKPGQLTASDLATLEAISGQLAVALDNATLYEAPKRQAQQLRLINLVGQAIVGILEVEPLLIKVGESLEESFGYYHVNVGLVEGDELVLVARHNARRQITIPETRLRREGPGLVAWCAKQGQPRLTTDVTTDPIYMPYPFFPDTRAELVLPLLAHDQTIGVLDVQSEQVNGLGETDLTLLQIISGQVAVAVENARLYAEARQRAEEVSALLLTTLSLSSSMQLDRRLDTIVQFARRLVEADSCTLYKLDEEAKLLRPIAVQDKYAEEISAYTPVLGEGITGYVAVTGKGELLNRVELDPRAKQIPGTPLTPENMIAMPLKVNDRVIGVMSVSRDGMRGFKQHDFNLISSFASQAAIAVESAELYKQLEERHAALQAAYDQLSGLDRLKDEMVQNVSHELRAPITFLKSYVDLLLSGELGPLQPEQEKGLRVVADKTNTLARLVNDIFMVHVISAETIKKLPLDLVALARGAADGVDAAARAAGLKLTAQLPDESIMVMGDAPRLMQVFDNLLGNAMKFTDSGGEIQVNVRLVGEQVRAEVRDTGLGIATDKLNRIFDRFYQVDGTAKRRKGGIGLGLSISRQIIEAHGGQLGVESHRGQGSCFFFVLSVIKSDEPPLAEIGG